MSRRHSHRKSTLLPSRHSTFAGARRRTCVLGRRFISSRICVVGWICILAASACLVTADATAQVPAEERSPAAERTPAAERDRADERAAAEERTRTEERIPAGEVETLGSRIAAAEAPIDSATGTIPHDDALVREVFGSGDSSRFEEGAETYLRLLVTKPVTKSEEEILLRHIGPAVEVMPRQDRPDRVHPDTPLASVGELVALWWRRQDPFPSSRRNERLEEHLSRWAFALDAFSTDRDDWGFDDRGTIYIRFGSPGKHLSIRLDETRRAYAFANSLVLPDLPDSEMWVYRHVHDEAYYFFSRDTRRSGFRLAHPSETIPSTLSAGMDYRNQRGRQKSTVLLHLMEEVYAQLALAHPIFGSTYDEVVRFRLPTRSSMRPDQFARSTLAAASSSEIESAVRRNEIVPASFSETTGLTEALPIESRWARFLEPDGSTRTEIYWSVDSARLDPSRRLKRMLIGQGHSPTDRYLLAASVTRQTPDYRPREVQTRHYMIDATPEPTPEPTTEPMSRSTRSRKAQTFVVRGDTSLYNVAAEWSQHWTIEADGGHLGEGAMLKLATLQLDSLRALNGREGRLEMSDLKAVFPSSPEIPYPFEKIEPSNPPDLYFELYHLNYGPDDQTRYTIEYEVTRPSDSARAEAGTSTAARTTSTGGERVARERIGLDLETLRDADAIRITVRATDEIGAESIEKSIQFSIVD